MNRVVFVVLVLIEIALIGCKKEVGEAKDSSDNTVNDTIYIDNSVIINGIDTFTFLTPKVGDTIYDVLFDYEVLSDTTLKVITVKSEAITEEGVLNIPDSSSKGYAVVKNSVVICKRGMRVTVMGEMVMYKNKEVKKVFMPSVEVVEKQAFYETNLIEVYMEKVVIIGEAAFYKCSALKTVKMPKVKKVQRQAFQGSILLENIEMPEVETIETGAFWLCYAFTDIELPKVRIIEDYAFIYCRGLINVKLPQVENIGEEAFAECSLLENVDMHIVKTIGSLAFSLCPVLTNVNMPKTTCCFLPDSFEGSSWKPGVGNSIVSSCAKKR